jgi:hypothetical protein
MTGRRRRWSRWRADDPNLSYGPTQPQDPSPGRVLLEPSAGKPGTGSSESFCTAGGDER